MITVYGITNAKINELIYIGIAKNLEQRIKQELNNSNKSLLTTEINKYNKEDFIWNILGTFETREEAAEKETELILEYRTRCNSKLRDRKKETRPNKPMLLTTPLDNKFIVNDIRDLCRDATICMNSTKLYDCAEGHNKSHHGFVCQFATDDDLDMYPEFINEYHNIIENDFKKFKKNGSQITSIPMRTDEKYIIRLGYSFFEQYNLSSICRKYNMTNRTLSDKLKGINNFTGIFDIFESNKLAVDLTSKIKQFNTLHKTIILCLYPIKLDTGYYEWVILEELYNLFSTDLLKDALSEKFMNSKIEKFIY